MTTNADTLKLLELLAEEIYHRAAAAQSREERKALKGVQHSIERVLERLGHKVGFERMAPGPEGTALHNLRDALAHVPITGKGVDMLERRTPAAMASVKDYCDKLTAHRLPWWKVYWRMLRGTWPPSTVQSASD